MVPRRRHFARGSRREVRVEHNNMASISTVSVGYKFVDVQATHRSLKSWHHHPALVVFQRRRRHAGQCMAHTVHPREATQAALPGVDVLYMSGGRGGHRVVHHAGGGGGGGVV